MPDGQSPEDEAARGVQGNLCCSDCFPPNTGAARGADESSLEATPVTLAIDNILQKKNSEYHSFCLSDSPSGRGCAGLGGWRRPRVGRKWRRKPLKTPKRARKWLPG